MGLLDRFRGDSEAGVCKLYYEPDDVIFTVSAETHTIAYAVAVSRAEREALGALLDAEDAAGDRTETLSAALGSALDGEANETDAIVERIQRPRRSAEAIYETWSELATDDPDVVYLPLGLSGDLAAYVDTCRKRDENAADEFALPDTFETVASLLVRVKGATDRPENRVVIHRDRVPSVEPQSTAESPSSEESS